MTVRAAGSSRTEIRFGIVQGRLVQSPPGKLQWFPQEHWESEFFLASAVGIDFIELIAERQHNPENPIWTDSGRARILELVTRNKLSVYAFCADYVIDHDITASPEVLERALRLIDCGAALGCKVLVLPLFEHSRLTTDNSKAFLPVIRSIAEEATARGIRVCLETELTGDELLRTLDLIDHPSVGVVFDTGNRVAFGHDLAADIALLGSSIQHVHIKDKNAENQNVLLGTGMVNFLEVFKALAAIDYAGPFTFEAQRGIDPIRTAKFNIALVEFFHAEMFTACT